MERANGVGSDPSDPVLDAPVFVTGGSGFVGGAVVDHLASAGAEVRALARSRSAAESLATRGAIPVRGDLANRAELAASMSKCDLVFHVAGVNTMCPKDPGLMYRTNVDDVRTVVGAAADAGVRRIVLTSSAAAIGEPEGVIADEWTPHTGSFMSHYARSKYLGERAFFEATEQCGVEGVAVNPSSVQGPGRAAGSTLLLRYALGTERPLAIETTLSIVDIDDCARGHLLAALRGSAGARYLLSGASLTVSDVIALLAEITGRAIRPVMLPRSLATMAYPVAAVAGVASGDQPFCVEMLRTLLHGHRFDVARSEAELSMAYTPIAETFVRTVEWLAHAGFVGR